ncbi:MAG: restriction endonuclease subunit S [Myxococcales bacterium]|nr:restriction endonuclease subunit S [Myxococcales bacterium]
MDLMTHLDNHLANLRAERERLSDVLALTRAQMMDGSDLTPLSDLAATDGIQIGPFGSQLHAHEYTVDGTPVVMPRDLVGGRVSMEKVKRVSAEVANRLSRHRLQAGDIVFPRRGDLSKRALITSTEEGWLCGTGCIRFRPAATVDGAQVFQSISGSAVTDWLVEHAVGTTMLNLNSQIVSALPVATPSEESAPLGSASLGLSECVDALGSEATALHAFRTALLASLLSGDLPVDANYDGIFGQVA